MRHVRWNFSWNLIETSPGVYDPVALASLDTTVRLCNAANIEIYWPIRTPPQWAWQSPNCCSCAPADIMEATHAAKFASDMATRYNGNTGHGFMDGIEIGNEDFDFHYCSCGSNPLSCRDPAAYIPVLRAVYPAIKAASPATRVGMFGMLIPDSAHRTSFMQGLYNAGANVYFDYANFHCYLPGAPGTGSGSAKSMQGQGDEIYAIMVAGGDAHKKVWITEFGWDATTASADAQRATWVQQAFDIGRTSPWGEHYDIYTMTYSTATGTSPYDKSITHGSSGSPVYTQTFTAIQQYIKQYPQWGSGGPPPAACLSSSLSALSFSAVQGGGNPSAQQVSITNCGTANGSWTAAVSTASGGNWLSVSPASGASLAVGASATLTASATLSGLAAGTYTGTITAQITAAGQTASAQVAATLTVTSSGGVGVSLSPSSMNYTATVGQGNPGSQTLTITNSGTVAGSWAATASTQSGGNWLSVSPASGGPLSVGANGTTTVSVSEAGMAAGTYSGFLTVSLTASGKTATATCTITFTLLAQTGGSVPHILIVPLENTGYSQVIGDTADWPNLNNYAKTYGLSTQFYGTDHPSLANYLVWLCGNDHGNPGDIAPPTPRYGDTTIVDELAAKGVPWAAYFQTMPTVGYTGGDTGGYLQHHNAFVYFQSIVGTPAQLNQVKPVTGSNGTNYWVNDMTSATPPAFVWHTPDANHDAHSGATPAKWKACDTYVGALVSQVQSWNWYTQNNGKIILVFDEAAKTDNGGTGDYPSGGGQVYFCVISEASKGVANYTGKANHAGLLKMLCEAYGVTQLGTSAHTTNGDPTPLLGAAQNSPCLSASPTSLSFSGTAGGANPASQNVTLANCGATSGNWATTVTTTSGGNWLSVSPTGGTLAAGASGTFAASMNISGMAAGTYTGTITSTLTITGGAKAVTSVPVTLTISPSGTQACLSATPAVMAFSARVGGSVPAAQSATLTNCGTLSGNWASVISTTDGHAWLAVTPPSGNLGVGATFPVSVSVDPTKVPAAGTYTGTVQCTISNGGGSSSASIGVTFTYSQGVGYTLLPGQVILPGGVSNFTFGGCESGPWATPNFYTSSTIQGLVRTGGFTLVRTYVAGGTSLATIDSYQSAVANAGCAMLAALDTTSDAAWCQSVVTHLGSRCLLYEIGNEPDFAGVPASQYVTFWNTVVPSLRAINPAAAFIGPVISQPSATAYLTTFLNGVKASGVLPDGISFHEYPCGGGITQAQCATRAGDFTASFASIKSLVTSILGKEYPLCLTEWNFDSGNPPAAYGDDPAFMQPWTTTAFNAMVGSGAAITTVFDLCSFAGSGHLDIIDHTTQTPRTNGQYTTLVGLFAGLSGGAPTDCLTANPTTMSFSATVGGGLPPTQSATLTNCGTASGTWTSAVTTVDGHAWLSISGTTSGSLGVGATTTTTIHVDQTKVPAAGTYHGTAQCTITTTGVGGGSTSASIAVTLTVSPSGGGPCITLSPTSFPLSATTGGGNPPPQTLTLTNCGGASGNWSAVAQTSGGTITLWDVATWDVDTWDAVPGGNWLSVSPASGQLSVGGAFDAQLLVNTTGLVPGVYQGTVTATITAGGQTASASASVTLTLTSSSGTACIGISPSPMSFSASQGGSAPPAQTATITNCGGATETWAATFSYGAGASGWLSFSPNSGTLSAGTAGVTSVLCAPAGLPAGTYSATATLTATAGSSTATATLPVTFTIGPPAIIPCLSVSPTSMTFAGVVNGSAPAPQSLMLLDCGQVTETWNTSYSYGAGASGWLSLSPNSGSLSAGGTGSTLVSADPTGLPAGTYTATATMTATAGTNGTTAILSAILTVTASTQTPCLSVSPSSLIFTATQGGAPPFAQTATLTSCASVVETWGSSLSYGAGASGWLSLSPNSGSLSPSAVQTANVLVDQSQVATPGTYTCTITTTATVSGGVSVSQSTGVTLTLLAPSQTPCLSVSPSSLSFTGVQGQAAPPSQGITAANCGSVSETWSTALSYGAGASGWLSLSPGSGSLSSGNAVTPLVSVDPTQIGTPGTYSATLTSSAQVGSNTTTAQIAVSMTLLPMQTIPPGPHDALSRFRLANGQDTFIRADTASGWGPSASDGELWNFSPSAALTRIASNTGEIYATTLAQDQSLLALLGTGVALDGEALVRFSITVANDGINIVLRSNGASTYYHLGTTGTTLFLARVTNGTDTNLLTMPVSVSLSTRYWYRARITGLTLSAKLWQDGTAEPANWTLQVSDTSANAITSAGQYGLRGRPGSATSVLRFDSFAVTAVPASVATFHDVPGRLLLCSDQDTFQRAPVATSWGAAFPTGSLWLQTGTRATISTNGAQGLLSQPQGISTMVLGHLFAGDAEGVAAMRVSGPGDTAGLFLRYQGSGMWYSAQVSGGPQAGTPLLPGQTFVNGVSNYLFGTNMGQDFAANTVRNTPAIQSQFKAGGFTVMRCAMPPGSSGAFIDQTASACVACGCAMLAILSATDNVWNQSLVTSLGNRCLLYEFGNEPDVGGIAVSTYLANWNSFIPALRAINPGAAFIGPALGIFANINSYLVPWLQGCVTSGVMPDGVSYHAYPCTDPACDQACCTPKSGVFQGDAATIRAAIASVTSKPLALCLTEWNIDASNPPKAYTYANPFNATWTQQALASMVAGHLDMACQWDAAGNAGGGFDDLVSTVSPYPQQVQYAPMVAAITTYLGGGGGGSAGSFALVRDVGGTLTTLASVGATVTPGVAYRARFRVVGTQLTATFWIDGTPEPGSPTLTVTDTSITGKGQWGLLGNAGSASPILYDWVEFSTNDLPGAFPPRDTHARTRLTPANTGSDRDTAARLRLLSRSSIQDAATRFRLSLSQTVKDSRLRLRLGSPRKSPDGAARFLLCIDQDTFNRADVAGSWGTSAGGETWNQTFSALPSLVNKSGQVTGSGTSGGGGLATPASDLDAFSAASQTTPNIMIVMLENHSYTQVIGNAAFPHLNALNSAYGAATNYYATGHPSLPNYLVVMSGGNQGCNADTCSPGYGATTFVDSLESAGISWKGYFENLPSVGYTGGDTGGYTQHHNPFVYFTSITGNATKKNKIVPYTQFTTDLHNNALPSFVWITPNDQDNGHTGSDTACDNWVNTLVTQVQASSWYTTGQGKILIMWDEGLKSDTHGIGDYNPGGAHVAFTLVAQSSLGIAPYTGNVNHAGLLKALEEAYGVTQLGTSAHTVNGDITPLFGNTTVASSALFSQLGARTLTDSESHVRFRMSATGGECASLVGRVSSSMNYYRLQCDGSQILLQMLAAGTPTTLASTTVSIIGSTNYWLHLRILGANLAGNLWADGTPEPGGWMVTAHDTTYTAAGGFGLRSLLLTTSDTVNYDNFVVWNGAPSRVLENATSRLHLRGQGVLHDVSARLILSQPALQKDERSRLKHAAIHPRDTAGRTRVNASLRRDVEGRLRLIRFFALHDTAARVHLVPLIFRSVSARLRLSGLSSSDTIYARLLLSGLPAKSLPARLLLHGGTDDMRGRVRLVASLSPSDAVSPTEQYSQQRAALLPDGSLVATLNVGSTTSAYGSPGCLVVRSVNWSQVLQGGGVTPPTWTLEQQLSAVPATRAALFYDAGTSRLHTVTATTASAGGNVIYLGATYSAGVLTWDGAGTVLSGTGSCPSVISDSAGTIFVAYRDFAGGTTYTVRLLAYSGGVWQPPFQISVTQSGVSADYYVALTRIGPSTTLLVTYEQGSLYAMAHADANGYNVWGSPAPGPAGYSGGTVLTGPLSLSAETSISGWVSVSSTAAGKTGLSVARFTISGTLVTWQGIPLQIESTPNTSAGAWTSINDLLWLFYHKSPSSGVSDIWYATYDVSTSLWGTPQNLARAGGLDNVLADVPPTGLSLVIPVLYTSGSGLVTTVVQQNLVASTHGLSGRLRLGISRPPQDQSMRVSLLAVAAKNGKGRLRIFSISLDTIAGRLLLVGTRLPDTRARLFLAGVRPLDVQGRVIQRAVRGDDAVARLFFGSLPLSRDIGQRALVIGSPDHDVPVRLLLQVTRVGNIPCRLLLIRAFPLACRLLVIGIMVDDVFARVPLLAVAARDTGSRLWLGRTRGRDVNMRFALYTERGASLRTRLLASAARDTGTRMPLLSGRQTDTSGRLKMASSQRRDVRTRLPLAARSRLDTAGRVVQLAQKSSDSSSRFILRLPGQGLGMTGMRLVLSAMKVSSLPGRLSLFLLRTDDTGARVRTRALASPDRMTRLRLASVKAVDTSLRLLHASLQKREIGNRLRTLATRLSDQASRGRISVLIVMMATARLRVAAVRPADSRLRIMMAAVNGQDGATRLRLMQTHAGDTTGRVTIGQLRGRDQGTRARIASQALLSTGIATRLRMPPVGTRDTTTRLTHRAVHSTDMAVRAQVSVLMGRDVPLRLALSSVVTRDAELRFCMTSPFHVFHARFSLSVQVMQDMESRVRIIDLTTTETSRLMTRDGRSILVTRDGKGVLLTR